MSGRNTWFMQTRVTTYHNVAGDVSITERTCTKRRLDTHQDEISPQPRKKRKVNTVSSHDTYLDEHANLSHSNHSMPFNPTPVTILSSCEDTTIGDGQHSNVPIFRNAHKKSENDNPNNQTQTISTQKEESEASTDKVTNQSRCIRLLLDAKHVGGLIGKGGSAISKIRETSQAKIFIAMPISYSLFRMCSIEGTHEEIARGINLVIDKMAEESKRLPPFRITILVEEMNIGCLIGKKGCAITEIRKNTDANIYISSHLLRHSTEKTVDISGERDAVHSAVEMVIKRLVCDNPKYVSTRVLYDQSKDLIQSPSPHMIPALRTPIHMQSIKWIKCKYPMRRAVLPIAANLIGCVIGRNGRNIQEIRCQTNAQIVIDNEKQNQTTLRYITIHGTPQQVSTALYMIQSSLVTHT
eukprot:269437_1